jgi:hypothetical protein
MMAFSSSSRKQYLLSACQKTIDEWKKMGTGSLHPSGTPLSDSATDLTGYCQGLSNLLAYNINKDYTSQWQASYQRHGTHGWVVASHTYSWSNVRESDMYIVDITYGQFNSRLTQEMKRFDVDKVDYGDGREFIVLIVDMQTGLEGARSLSPVNPFPSY